MTIDSSPALQIKLPISITVGDYLEGQISSAIATQYGEKVVFPYSEPLCRAVENAISAKDYNVEMITCFFSSQRPEIAEHSYVMAYLKGPKNRVYSYRAWIDTETEERYFGREPIHVDLPFQCLGRDEFFEKDWKEVYSDYMENFADKCILFLQNTVRKVLR